MYFATIRFISVSYVPRNCAINGLVVSLYDMMIENSYRKNAHIFSKLYELISTRLGMNHDNLANCPFVRLECTDSPNFKYIFWRVCGYSDSTFHIHKLEHRLCTAQPLMSGDLGDHALHGFDQLHAKFYQRATTLKPRISGPNVYNMIQGETSFDAHIMLVSYVHGIIM